MADPAMVRCLYIIASLTLQFHWEIVGRCNFGKRIFLEAQELFITLRNSAMTNTQKELFTQYAAMYGRP